jgi:hypothetical protein
MTRKRGIGWLMIVAVLTASACRGEASRREPVLLPPVEAAVAVSDLLYRQNLIVDPEVNERMNRYVLQVSRDGQPTDSVMPRFHRWLVEWAAQHPDRVALAREQPAPYVVRNAQR